MLGGMGNFVFILIKLFASFVEKKIRDLKIHFSISTWKYKPFLSFIFLPLTPPPNLLFLNYHLSSRQPGQYVLGQVSSLFLACCYVKCIETDNDIEFYAGNYIKLMILEV